MDETSGASDPLVGQRIGNYEIDRLIGAGGMGRVYLGIQRAIGSRVAIKVLRPESAQRTDLVDRFFDEARAVNLIHHESIVNVLDLSTLPDGRPFIVMEYLDGAPLSELIRWRGSLPLGSVARVMSEALDALEAAHAKGIVHRDLKPDNIFVTRREHAKVLDFGIAKLHPDLGSAAGPTHTGSLIGTPHYMAPEQALARPADARTDIYAVGVILFEAVTGRPPFSGDSLFELLRQQVEKAPPTPREMRPDLPAEYEEVILKALAKDPAQRFQSAGVLAAALNRATEGLGPHAWAPLGVAEGKRAGVASSSVSSQEPTRPSQPHGGPVAYITTMASSPGEVGRPNEGRSRGWLWLAGGIGVAAIVAVTVVLTLDSGPPGPSPRETVAGAIAWPRTAPGREATAGARTAGMGRSRSLGARAAGARTPPGPLRVRSAEQVRPPDLRRFPVSGFIPKALAMARERFPDAVLVRLDAAGVYPNGEADLTLDDSFYVLYRFRSPKESRRPKGVPLGVTPKVECLYYVMVQKSGIRAFPPGAWPCADHLLGPPKCSVRQVWQKAIARGAPKNAVATVGYWSGSAGRGRWYFSVQSAFGGWIEDSCP